MNSHRSILPRSWGALSWPSRPGMLFLRALLALVFLSTLAPHSAFSQEADSTALLPTWTKYSVDAPPYFTNMTDRSLAFDPYYGIPCVAYGGDALYFSCKGNADGSWNTAMLDNGANVGEYAAITFDNYGLMYITYYDALNGRLKLVYSNGVSWVFLTVPNVLGSTPLPAGALERAEVEAMKAPAAPSVMPVVDFLPQAQTPQPDDGMIQPPSTSKAFVPNSDDPIEDNSVDTLEEPDEPSALERIQQFLQPWADALSPDFPFRSKGYGKYSSIAIDRENGIHITFYDEVDGSLEYVYWDGIDWHGTVVDDYNDQGTAGLWSSVAVDFNFNVNIAYMSEKYDDLKYARKRNAGGWEVETVDSAANVGSFSSIAVEPMPGNNAYYEPHISYYDFTGDRLKHAWRDHNKNWHATALDGGGITGWYTSIAIDPSNRIHISYYNASKGDLKYARYDGSWSFRTLESTGNANIGLFTSIAVDRFGRPGIAYVHASLGALKYIYSPQKTEWNSPVTIASSSKDVGLATSIAVSNSGVPYVSYLDASSGGLKLARSYGVSWSTTTLVSRPYSGLFSSIDLLGGAIPQIAYYEQEQRDLSYAQEIGISNVWHFQNVDSTWDVGQFVSMELGTNGMPHMSYYDARTQDLLYGTWDIVESDWVTTTLDYRPDHPVGLYTSIALDNTNRPFISYYDSGVNYDPDQPRPLLKISFKSPTNTWIQREVYAFSSYPDPELGAYSSIDVDNLGRPHISFYDFEQKVLKYAYWNGVWPSTGSWNITTVDPAAVNGQFNSLVINQADNTSHICYYDFTYGGLKYAQWPGGVGAWQRQMVDGYTGDGDGIEEGDVGQFCSIDLNLAGQPVISYYDNSHADLKVATSYALPVASLYLPFTVIDAP